MENLQIISVTALAISVAGIVLVTANVLSFQNSLVNLNTDLVEQSQSVKSAGLQANATQQLVQGQQQFLSQAGNNIRDLTGELRSLESRVGSLEQGLQPHCQALGGCAQSHDQPARFVPVALEDDKANLWTSWFIKESLYYPTLYSTSCDAPSVDCYVHFSNISAPNGTGIEADTIGSGVYGYWFLGYSQEYVVPANGTVTISGNFMKNNTFGQVPGRYVVHPQGRVPGYGMMQSSPVPASSVDNEGMNHVFVFILDRDPDVILAQKQAVLPSDNTTTWYHRSVTFSLPPGQVFRVGIGAENNWAEDYNIYVAWNGITIRASPAWSPVQ